MKTCLIVDDTPFDRKMLGLCAQKVGLNVTSAATGEEAIAACEESLPDLVLLDWEMQGMGGIELLKKLRQIKGAAEVPMIVCTSHEHPSFIGHAYIHGASSYLTKPVTRKKLAGKLSEMGITMRKKEDFA